MEWFGSWIQSAYSLFSMPFEIFGFHFTFFNVFMFSIVASVVGYFISRFFGD